MSDRELSSLNDAAIAAVMKEAAEAFVDVFFAKVPFYTGLSRGQVAGLAAAAGVKFTGPSISDSGIEGETLKFDFNVEHFLINEVADASKWGIPLKHPGPYNAIPAALAAADEVMTAAANRLLDAAIAEVFSGVSYVK